MDKPAKPMKITDEMVRFQVIEHNSNFRWGREYVSDFRYATHTFVPTEQIQQHSMEIESYMRHKHIEIIDYGIYGQYRKYLKAKLFKLTCELDKYKRTYGNNISEYVIPERDVSLLVTELLELINETE